VRASCSVSAKISDSEENLPSDVELDAQFEFAIDTLFLAKSKKRYGGSGGPCLFCGTIRKVNKTILLMVPVFYVANVGVD
jgi:hypothetical protein